MKPLLFLLAFFSARPLFSQVHFEPGYFVTNDGKRTSCLLKNSDWDSNPKSFFYKLNENDATEKAGLETVKEFGIGSSAKFKRFTVDVDTSKADFQNLGTSSVPEIKRETLFLRVLVEGKASLLSYKNGSQTWFYYEAGDSAVALVYKKYKTSETSFGENATFKSQLMETFSCQELSAEYLQGLAYHVKDLTGYFLNYNNCMHVATVQYSKPGSGKFALWIRPGVAFTSYNINYTISDFGVTQFKSKPCLRLGLMAEFVLPFNKNKWSVAVEPTFEMYKSEEPSANSPAYADYKAINVPLTVSYHIFLSDNATLFLDAGYGYNTPVNTTLIAKNGFKPRAGSSGSILAGAGFSAGRFSVEARYNLPRNTLDQYANWRADLKSFMLVAGFKLF